MKKYVFIWLFFIGQICYSQTDSITMLINEIDSSLKASKEHVRNAIESSRRKIDSLYMTEYNEQNIRNLNAFVADQQEKQRKQKTRNWIRIGVGVMMLVLLVVGLTRKKKNNSGS